VTNIEQDRLTVAPQDKLVTVITPVYNGAAYLQACIDSVRSQSYENFEYFIVDNCSTDSSAEIAAAAADEDSRITVIRCDEHVGPIQNWNRSLNYVHSDSEYVKFVHADDWLFPDCIERMVELADRYQKVGIVSAYRLEENRVSIDKLPDDAPLVPGERSFAMDGRSVASAILYKRASVIGSPTNFLLRASLVRDSDPFFSDEVLHADKEACLRSLQECDFGFIRQVLSFTRRHNESVTSLTNVLDTRRQENLLLLQEYGPIFLTEAQYQSALDRELKSYYRFLASNIGAGHSSEFWDSHATNLGKAGVPFSRAKLVFYFVRRWTNPAMALKELLGNLSGPVGKEEQDTHSFLKLSRSNKPSKTDGRH